MKLRASIFLGSESATLNIFSNLSETADHLVLKLAAFLFYFEQKPEITMNAQHNALLGQEYWPDLLSTDLTGQVRLWVECGKTTLHKLEKVTKRYRESRVIVLTALPHEGRQMAESLQRDDNKRVEVWSFPEGDYARWRVAVGEQNDIVGEATETSLNLVINEHPFMTQLQRFL